MARNQDADVARLRLHGTIVEGRIIEVNLATLKNSTTKPFTPAKASTVWRKPKRFARPTPRTLMEVEANLAEAQRGGGDTDYGGYHQGIDSGRLQRGSDDIIEQECSLRQ